MIAEHAVTMFHEVCNLCGEEAKHGAPMRPLTPLPAGWERFDVTSPAGDTIEVCICKTCLSVLGVEPTEEEEGNPC